MLCDQLYISMVKVKLLLCFNQAPPHEDVLGEWRYSSTHTLTSALDESEVRFTPRALYPLDMRLAGQ
jgi:hypothetical protein